MMEHDLIFGFFSLYAGVISLVRFLSERDDPYLNALKRGWGRLCGLVLHFIARISLPLVAGIFFLGLGIAEYASSHSLAYPSAFRCERILQDLALQALAGQRVLPSEVLSSGEIALLLPASSGSRSL